MADAPVDLHPGDVVWIAPDPIVGREQAGRRPGLIVAGTSYLATVDTLAIIVPLTTVQRGWPNHIAIVGAELPQASWAMSEQVRTVSRERIAARAGRVDDATLHMVRLWISDFLDL